MRNKAKQGQSSISAVTVPAMPWGWPVRRWGRGVLYEKIFPAPSFRFRLACSLSKSFYDFGFRSAVYFFGRYKTLVFKSNGDFAVEIIHNGLTFLICNQTAFIGFPSIHARDSRQSVGHRLLIFSGSSAHSPNAVKQVFDCGFCFCQ